MRRRRLFSFLTLVFVLFFISAPAASADEGKKNELKFVKFNQEKLSKDNKVSMNETIDVNKAVQVLKDNFEEFRVKLPKNSMKKVKIKKDKLGFTHVKMQQTFEGIPIYGKEYIVHFDKSGKAYAANGYVEFDLNKKLSMSHQKKVKETKVKEKDKKLILQEINKEQALQIALKATNAGELQAKPEIDMYYYEHEGEYYKVYKVRVNFLLPEPGDWHVFINVNNGEILNKYNAIAYANSDATGVGVLGDSKSFKVTYTGGEYNLIETKASGTRVITYDAGNRTFFPQWFLPGDVVVSDDNIFDSSRDGAAVDAHVYASNVYDYYKEIFNRNSIDNNGMDIKSSVHYYRNYVNAFWNGYQMVYGDGNGVDSIELCGALDVVAHEITHGVTSHEANLQYQNQSGALNESFSDVFGTFVEFKYQSNKADWLCGEDIWTPNVAGDALRSMSNPTLYGQPDHMNNYLNTTEDNGGVHTNSGIPNKAAYLVATSIGIEKTEQIYYRALTVYLTTTSDFSDCRAALLQSAEDLYGTGTEYNAIVSAFNTVGIY
ncbi:M4 family metallopeptidase [Oceanirhabdus sp. W0125-5]|uniref:M4 family metallopeptidase n=1 Tax=Oceanirhabdus sp. W0125-5 TaxID=2999116 RepID=UPI0022F2D3BB|nr:M4 family metallopeptidase [Oceanirhabdus sp. W0125-5]WBW98729.1 M4 family metallopeptidase [Oceanirhabdus sp. W0125-5]